MPVRRGPRVTMFPSDRAAARALARRIADAIASHPELVLGLPTGRTPVALYHELASLHAHGRLDLSRITTFNLDEFLGVGPADEGSYHRFMHDHLFSRVNIPPSRQHMLNGTAPDPERHQRGCESAGARVELGVREAPVTLTHGVGVRMPCGARGEQLRELEDHVGGPGGGWRLRARSRAR